MKFYSGKGDNGTSTLFGSGKRIPKTNMVFEALGALDELNSYLGICKSLSKNRKIRKILEDAQENLFMMQARIGGARNVPDVGVEKLKALESATDLIGAKLGIITKFIITGDNILSAHIDYARTLARKSERVCLTLKSGCRGDVAYLNRLSSLLFVLARYTSLKSGKKEKNPSYK